MPGSSGTTIVREALEAQRAFPQMAPLDLLDYVMRRHYGSNPDFETDHPEYSHDIDPPSPFGEILRQAFAPDIPSDAFQLLERHDLNEAELRRAKLLEMRWTLVVDQFAERYELWSA